MTKREEEKTVADFQNYQLRGSGNLHTRDGGKDCVFLEEIWPSSTRLSNSTVSGLKCGAY